MKYPIVCALVVAGLAAVGGLFGDEPLPTPGSEPTATSKSAALIDQVYKDRDASQKRLLETHQRTIAMLDAGEALLKRQQDDATRFEKILAIWEKQQAQYQKYLDSLSAK